MNKRICIVANGRLEPILLESIAVGDMVIGVDRAAFWLIQHEVLPDVAIGDFDSVTPEEMKMISKNVEEVKCYKPEKNYTDTELALRFAIRFHPVSIIILGGSGTRLDHTMGTLQLLEASAKCGIPTVFRDETNEVVVVGRGRTILIKRGGCRYVSFIPITNTIQLTLSGFKYEITKKTIHRGQTIGISNEFTGRQADVTIHRGRAFIIQSRD
ncbi:MAG TPA: thiamine diphosphokinase [Patescibacteria group bacterium]|jgi:thiamine pyrophosphokinase|nr:thiamine diphosphokinase [Patescibacteria group bacterium]